MKVDGGVSKGEERVSSQPSATRQVRTTELEHRPRSGMLWGVEWRGIQIYSIK